MNKSSHDRIRWALSTSMVVGMVDVRRAQISDDMEDTIVEVTSMPISQEIGNMAGTIYEHIKSQLRE